MPNEITEQRIDELKAEILHLWKYVRHLPHCEKKVGYFPDGTMAGHNEEECTCGLEGRRNEHH